MTNLEPEILAAVFGGTDAAQEEATRLKWCNDQVPNLFVNRARVGPEFAKKCGGKKGFFPRVFAGGILQRDSMAGHELYTTGHPRDSQ